MIRARLYDPWLIIRSNAWPATIIVQSHRDIPAFAVSGRTGTASFFPWCMTGWWRPVWIPLRQKPIFHFKPGSLSYSIAAPGCNFNCRFCQNADISQVRDQGEDPFSGRLAGNAMTPEEIVAKAVESGCQSISYTYTEPTVFFELVLDTAMLAKDAGLANIIVTNGFMSPKTAAGLRRSAGCCQCGS